MLLDETSKERILIPGKCGRSYYSYKTNLVSLTDSCGAISWENGYETVKPTIFRPICNPFTIDLTASAVQMTS